MDTKALSEAGVHEGKESTANGVRSPNLKSTDRDVRCQVRACNDPLNNVVSICNIFILHIRFNILILHIDNRNLYAKIKLYYAKFVTNIFYCMLRSNFLACMYGW